MATQFKKSSNSILTSRSIIESLDDDSVMLTTRNESTFGARMQLRDDFSQIRNEFSKLGDNKIFDRHIKLRGDDDETSERSAIVQKNKFAVKPAEIEPTMPSGVHEYEESKEVPEQKEQTEDKEDSISFITPPYNPENDKEITEKKDVKAFNNEVTPTAPDHGNLKLFVNSFNHAESEK